MSSGSKRAHISSSVCANTTTCHIVAIQSRRPRIHGNRPCPITDTHPQASAETEWYAWYAEPPNNQPIDGLGRGVVAFQPMDPPPPFPPRLHLNACRPSASWEFLVILIRHTLLVSASMLSDAPSMAHAPEVQLHTGDESHAASLARHDPADRQSAEPASNPLAEPEDLVAEVSLSRRR